MEVGLFAVRVIVGLLFAAHGAQKLFGVLGGHGLAGTGGFFESLGLKPGKPMAFAAGASEFFGGVLLAFGLFTPVAALMLTATMVVAIAVVHGAKGPWASNGGYEYNLVLIAIVFALSATGAGAWSLDDALGLDLSGAGWAFGQLALGLLGGAAVVLSGRLGAARSDDRAQATPA